VTKDFELLVSLDKVHVIAKDKDSSLNSVTLKPGHVVAVNQDGKIVKGTAGKLPLFVVISDEAEPVTLASGKVSLMFGIARFKTKLYDTSVTYAVGDGLTVKTNDVVLTKVSTGQTPCAYVESITSDGYLIVRWAI
jgi:hypothetical protein